jgi:hypothetical protein
VRAALFDEPDAQALTGEWSPIITKTTHVAGVF